MAGQRFNTLQAKLGHTGIAAATLSKRLPIKHTSLFQASLQQAHTRLVEPVWQDSYLLRKKPTHVLEQSVELTAEGRVLQGRQDHNDTHQGYTWEEREGGGWYRETLSSSSFMRGRMVWTPAMTTSAGWREVLSSVKSNRSLEVRLESSLMTSSRSSHCSSSASNAAWEYLPVEEGGGTRQASQGQHSPVLHLA